MADETLKLDANNKPVAGAVTDDSNQYIKMLRVDDATKGLKVMVVGGIPIVAGSDQEVQFNQLGSLGASSNFKFDYTNQVVKVGDGTPTYTVGSNNILNVTKTVNSYFAVNIQNLSAGVTASSDIILNNNSATDTTNYFDIGIASTLNADPAFPILGSGKAYLYNASTATVLANGTASPFVFATGGVATSNEVARLLSGTLSLGLANTTLGKLTLYGSTSGNVSIQPNAVAGSNIVLTAPATTGTIALTSQLGNLTVGTSTISSGTNTRILYDNSGILGEYTITGTGTVVAMQTNPTLSGLTITDATNIVLDTTTGTKIGTATNQKLAFYNSTPIVKPSGDVTTALTNLGLVTTPTINADTVSSANEATDTTCFPLFITASGTQTLATKNNTNLTFNSNTAILGSTIFNAGTGFQIGGVASSGKILKANGTNFVASTETYAAPGTSGNVMTSDGTNWTSAAPAGGATPAWVSEGSATTWSADNSDKTITLANTGKDMYMLLITGTAGNVSLSLQFNGDTGAHYMYRYYSNTGIGQSTGQTSLILCDAGNNNVGRVMQVYFTGVASSGSAIDVAVTSGIHADNASSNVSLSGCWTSASNITSVKIMVNGVAFTGKAHLYSLNL